MSTAKQGDTVHVHYTGRLDDGTVFDSSRERRPIEFTIGEDRIISGFQRAVEGMSVGEKSSASIPPEEAYGARSEELVMSVPRAELPDGADPSVGDRLELRTGDGYKIPVRVTDTDESAIEVDANHPLAGKDLHFDLELVAIA